MKSAGFTVVEVLVVIALIAVIVTVAALNFGGMSGKATIEKQATELHAALSNARLNALQSRLRSAVVLGPRQIVFKTYSSESEPSSAGRTVRTTSFPHEIQRRAPGGALHALNPATDRIEFDTRGFTNYTTTLLVLPSTMSGGLDCVVVQTGRTGIGRVVNATACSMQ